MFNIEVVAKAEKERFNFFNRRFAFTRVIGNLEKKVIAHSPLYRQNEYGWIYH